MQLKVTAHVPFIKHTVAVKVSFSESKTVKNYIQPLKGTQSKDAIFCMKM